MSCLHALEHGDEWGYMRLGRGASAFAESVGPFWEISCSAPDFGKASSASIQSEPTRSFSFDSRSECSMSYEFMNAGKVNNHNYESAY